MYQTNVVPLIYPTKELTRDKRNNRNSFICLISWHWHQWSFFTRLDMIKVTTYILPL